ELLRRGLVQRVRVDVFQASATGADQRDLRIERTALTREHLEELVRIAVREARQIGARRLEAAPRLGDVAALGDVEESPPDRDAAPRRLDRALPQLLGTDRGPPDVVDRLGRDAWPFDECIRIEQAEVRSEG